MQVKRSRRSRPVLWIFLSVLLIAGLSYGGAILWQGAEDSLSGRTRSAPAQHVSPDVDEIILPRPALPETEVPAQPEDNPLEFVPGPFSADWQVRPSEAVDAGYFDDAIFFGDSVSTGMIANRIVGSSSVFAVIGATPQTILEEEYIYTPQGPLTMLEAAREKGDKGKVYIMLGSNSLRLETDEFISGYQRFINAVRAQYPSAVIYIQSMTPVAAHVREHHPEISREKVIEFNDAIAELARVNRLPFVNVFEALADENGYLPAHASADGLHLNAEHHFMWFDYLKTHTLGR